MFNAKQGGPAPSALNPLVNRNQRLAGLVPSSGVVLEL